MQQFGCMITLHSKSPCCQGKIYQHGQRRRQCSICKKTWRIRQKKRGKKFVRTTDLLVLKYLSNGGFNLEDHAFRYDLTITQLRCRIRKSLDVFLKRNHWQKIPERGKLILIVDAIEEKICCRTYTTYVILVRPINKNQAIILKPLICYSHENGDDWRRTFLTLSEDIRDRVVALVGDGKPCFKGISRRYGWLLQRCHFHLLAELYKRISYKRRSKHFETINEMIKIVRKIVAEKDDRKVEILVKVLKQFQKDYRLPERIRKTFISGFSKNFHYYRTYLKYPKFNLPSTTNSCENVNSFIRKLLGKAHGFKTYQSYSKWINALLLFRKTVTCNKKKIDLNFK